MKRVGLFQLAICIAAISGAAIGISASARAAQADAAGGWSKHPGGPVLGGQYGTCFDVAVLHDGGKYRMWVSWRPKAGIGLVESADGIHWSEPKVVLGPNRESKWEERINRPAVLKRGDTYHNRWLLWYNGRKGDLEQIGLATREGRDLWASEPPTIISPSILQRYVETFNRHDEELYPQHIPNAAAFDFLRANIPRFECPDKELEEIYHFRWWTYRKHLKQTPDGFVITEFLPKVSWSGKHNTINCPAGHHFYEGRWLRDPQYLDDYAIFWFRKGGEPRRYSFWAADALWARHLVHPNPTLLTNLLDDLVANYEAWEKARLGPEGLFWQIDDRDGMEVSIGGSGYRATINSYQYGDALAIARIARLAGREPVAATYEAKAARLKTLVLDQLWDPEAEFFKVLPRKGRNDPTPAESLADARELHGYTPWYFGLPEPRHAAAWRQLMDPQGFYAPFGPTTAEQRHPKFAVSYQGHECQWNGPSWPLATAVTLTGLANLLNGPPQEHIGAKDYFEVLKIYAKSHRLKREDGTVVPWIDENLNPHTGDWISRTRLKSWKNGTWDDGKGGRERGKDYNHSSFCDLVITGLVGLRPRADDVVEVNPLLPADAWDWFCLDGVPYHGRALTILWDKTGRKYGRGEGLRVLADGREIARAAALQRVTGKLP